MFQTESDLKMHFRNLGAPPLKFKFLKLPIVDCTQRYRTWLDWTEKNETVILCSSCNCLSAE